MGIETSRAGSLFDLESLTPGARAEARVTVRNSGTLAARWQLKATMRGDVAFLQRLRLTVREVDGAHRRVVFAGPLGSLTSVELGAVAAGENRRYAFSVSWPPRRQAEVPGPERAAVDFAWLAHSLR